MPLHEIEHDLISKAQRLPEEHASGGAERVRAISDRLWFKVKVGEHRGAGGEIVDPPGEIPMLWWFVAGGVRRSDSGGQDFYEALEAECKRQAKGSNAKVNSEHLLPQDIDRRRFEKEQVTLGVISLQQAVREAVCRSVHSGKPVVAATPGQQLIAWVKSSEADTYLAISAEGFLDHREIAVMLAAIPGMTSEDWQPEPNEVMGIKPDVGQLVFSAMIPPQSLAAILEQSPGGYL